MPILNYTTSIDAHKTVGEIQRILAVKGATRLMIHYDGQAQPVALMFELKVKKQPPCSEGGMNEELMQYRLPCRHQQVYERLRRDRDVPGRLKSEAQALRVSWRILKDWVEAQLAIVEAQMVDMPEVFLPYALVEGGQTFYERMVDVRFQLEAKD